MASGTHAAPVRRGLPVRLLTGLLAAVLALSAAVAASAATHDASSVRSVAVPAATRAHQPVVTTPHPVSRSTLQAVAHTATRHTAAIRLRPGDTLWGLAHRYGTTVAALQQANRLGTSTLIYAGHRLTIPTPAGPTARSSYPSHPHTVPTPSGATIAVAFARRQLGVPYLWGGSGNGGGYDCSGLVQAAWHAAGVTLPRTTTAQAQAGIRITRTQLRPGDLVFTQGYGHVELYAGHGRVIEAAHPKTRVRYATLPQAAAVNAYVRVPAHTTAAANATNASYTHTTTGSARQIAAQVFGSQHECAASIIARESGWQVAAANPASGAYGLAQALPGSKMAGFGSDWRTNPATQLRWMRSYVTSRYGGACAAWAFWQTHHWY
ncbi:NlpC/P60 family protein [Streptomyces sp. Li-HN-5-11]|uniref:aggregation-promoting factor C-terminal-like domain-containing protein n=1 Tax=Streptomyces sp. Li-HN-5-11 TaxID=3075432 RepID=UPI0028B027EC|nr:NlpC/P60 family protein [Streptomyces sp. Li-HN-5-11]WNM32761.1 NlpC/P60 family protein [Streptomyces sp. Li-HN-5-11]WOP38586.1 NlpC/P60 family protein [Streptomyces sp. Li-HN-5-13]